MQEFFFFLECFAAPAKLLFVNPLFSIGYFYLPVLFSSFCIFLECVILCQEWTWPTFQEHPFLSFPGFAISSHHVWFFMLVMLLEMSLDMRIVIAHIRLMYETRNPVVTAVASFQEGVALSMAIVPALLGFALLAATILCSSLWWEGRCGRVGRALQLYDEHLRLDPSPLVSEGARRVAEAAGREFSRVLACEGNVRREKMRRDSHVSLVRSGRLSR